MTSPFADPDTDAIPLHVVAQEDLESWSAQQDDLTRAWINTNGFTGRLGQALLVPDAAGHPALALAGWGTDSTRQRGRFHLAGAASKLPKGVYRIASGLPDTAASVEVLGWALAAYRFDRYHEATPIAAQLVTPKNVDTERLSQIMEGVLPGKRRAQTGERPWRHDQRHYRGRPARAEFPPDPYGWPRVAPHAAPDRHELGRGGATDHTGRKRRML